MYIPHLQTVITGGLALTGAMTDPLLKHKSKTIVSGNITDFAVPECLDAAGTQRCTVPFAVKKGGCYSLAWRTEGLLSHTTAEVRDAGSGEVVFYRDTDGEWEPEKAELVFVDFMPKTPGYGNDTVEYEVSKC